MKRALGIAAFGCSLTGVECSRWAPAHETLGVMPLLGQSPMPTEGPRLEEGALVERAAYQSTCAYVEGSADQPLYCASTARCVFAYDNSYIGCCDQTATDCTVWTTCLAKSQSAKFTTDNGLTLWCGQSEYPNCIRHVYGGSSLSGSVLWGCAVAQATDTIYLSPTDTPTATTTPPVTKSSVPLPTNTGAKDEGGSKFPIGPVVGGAVGGVVVIGLLGLVACLLIRSRRKKRNNTANPPPNASGPMSGQGPPQGPPGGGYNPSSPPMAQQGFYASGVAGFTPVNPRDSIAKPQFGQPGFDRTSTPGSPTPTALSGHTSPPPCYGNPNVAPTGPYPTPPQDYQATQQQAFYNAAPLQGYQSTSPQLGYPPVAYNQLHPNAPQGQTPNSYDFAAELPVTRGDGQVRELSG